MLVWSGGTGTASHGKVPRPTIWLLFAGRKSHLEGAIRHDERYHGGCPASAGCGGGSADGGAAEWRPPAAGTGDGGGGRGLPGRDARLAAAGRARAGGAAWAGAGAPGADRDRPG